MVELHFLTKAKFTKMVEDCVIENRISYMDAVIHLCEQNELEIEDMRKFISSVIKDKIEAEAMRLNFLPRQNTLPVD
jgi:hypothetical protein